MFQNYRECMTNAKYSKWNLEYTIELLSNRFQESNIWVVKPCEIQENTYSIYKNFVSSGIYGIPSHTSGQKSWHHLHLLIKHSFFALQDCGNGGSLADSHLSNSPLAILGFSKGCVVLNQLVYDLKDDIDEEVKAFIDRVETMYWLDGGHAGTSNTWITDADVLSEVPKLGIKVETHVTPYQVKDKARPWIGREYELFISRLKEFGVKVYNHKHFSNSPRSLDNHFAILELLWLSKHFLKVFWNSIQIYIWVAKLPDEEHFSRKWNSVHILTVLESNFTFTFLVIKSVLNLEIFVIKFIYEKSAIYCKLN